MNTDDNPMQSAHSAPRCTAKAKATGNRCNAPAKHGWAVCRMHGAGGGAPKGSRNGMWRHGNYTNEMAEIRAMVSEATRWAKSLAPTK